MNRPLKFRIYSPLDKAFHNFTLEESIAGRVSKPQQYTGLNDKNGKGIYEGDILKTPGVNDDVIGQVIYEADHGGYIFQWKRNGPNQHHTNLNFDAAFQSVIVGNIFEHSELLK